MKHKWLIAALVIVVLLAGAYFIISSPAGRSQRITSKPQLRAAARRWKPDCERWEAQWRGASSATLEPVNDSYYSWMPVGDELLLQSQRSGYPNRVDIPFRLTRIPADGPPQISEPWGALEGGKLAEVGDRTFLMLDMLRYPGSKLVELDRVTLMPKSSVTMPVPVHPEGAIPRRRPIILGAGVDGTRLRILYQSELHGITRASLPPVSAYLPVYSTNQLEYDIDTQQFSEVRLLPIHQRINEVRPTADGQVTLHLELTNHSVVASLRMAADRTVVEWDAGTVTPLPPLPDVPRHLHLSDATRPEDPTSANPGFVANSNIEEPPLAVAIEGRIEVPRPSRLPLFLQQLLNSARQAWQRLVPPPPRAPFMAFVAPAGAILGETKLLFADASVAHPLDLPTSAVAAVTAMDGTRPFQLHRLDSETALITQLVFPARGKDLRRGAFRFGTITPPSVEIAWLGYIDLPDEYAKFRKVGEFSLHPTDDAWLVGLVGRAPQEHPDQGPLSTETMYWWTRIPYPANWPYADTAP